MLKENDRAIQSLVSNENEIDWFPFRVEIRKKNFYAVCLVYAQNIVLAIITI